MDYTISKWEKNGQTFCEMVGTTKENVNQWLCAKLDFGKKYVSFYPVHFL
jgi:hypothetical protein